MSGLAMDFRAGAQGINEGIKYLGSSSGKTDKEIYEIKKKIIDKYISIKFFYYNKILFNETCNDRIIKKMEQNSIKILLSPKDNEDYEYIKDLYQEKLLYIDIVFDAFKIIYDKVNADDLRLFKKILEGDNGYIKKITPSMMKRKIESHMIPPPPFDVIGEGTWDFEGPEARTARVMIERGVWKTVDVPEVDHLGIPINEGDKFRIPHPKGPPKTKTEHLFEMIKVRNHTNWEKQSEQTYKKRGIGLALPWVALWVGRTVSLGDYGMYNNLRNINEYKWIFEELCRTYSWKRDKEIVKWLNLKIRSDPEVAFVPSLDRFDQRSPDFIQGQTPVSIYTKNANGGIDGLKWVFPDGSPIEETDATTGETKGMQMTKIPSRQVGKVDKINEIKKYAEELLDLRKEKLAERAAYRAAKDSNDKTEYKIHKEKYDKYKKMIENIKSNLKKMELWNEVEPKAVELYEIRQVNGGRRKVRKTRVGTRRFRKSRKKRTKRKRRKSQKKRTKRRKRRTKKGYRSANYQRKSRKFRKN